MKMLALILMILGIIIWSMIGIAKYQLIANNKISDGGGNTAPIQTLLRLIEPPAKQISSNLVTLTNSDTKPTNKVATNKSATTNIKPQAATTGLPKTLKITKLGLSASIESIGQDAAGRMAVPSGWYNVGWYNLGYRIGDNGSAVISGHYDTVTGSPASFYNLGKLNSGDTITVTLDNGKTYNFVVTSKQTYPWDGLPLESIFASSGTVGLNLITCGGTWDKGSHNYTQRVVVYSKLQ